MRLRLNLPTVAEANATRHATPKAGAVADPAKKRPGPTAKARAKKRRKEGPVKADVRLHCAQRDGLCRVAQWVGTDTVALELMNGCDGPSEWAHMAQKRQSKTRGQVPTVRHTTAESLMLCRRHHAQYDGRARPRLYIGGEDANAPLTFSRAPI
jgi:hypothetical protein